MPRLRRTAMPDAFREMSAVSSQVGEDNDCAVVAVAIACGVSYLDAHKALAAAGREPRKGTMTFVTISAVKSFGFNIRLWNWREYQAVIASYPGTHNLLHNITSHQPRRFEKSWAPHAAKTLLLRSNGHILAYKNGVVQDFSINRSLRIVDIYEVTKAE